MKTTSARRWFTALPLVTACLTLLVFAPAAHGVVLPPPLVRLFERPLPSNRVEYTIQNSTQPRAFDITLLVVENPTAFASSTTNPGWESQLLTAALWELPMGGKGANRVSWGQYTGLGYADLFAATTPANGYFVDYALGGDGRFEFPTTPCRPGETLAGFFFEGLMASTFLVAGPNDAATYVGDASDNPLVGINTFTSQAQPVPEPTTLLLAAALGIGLLLSPRTPR